MVVTTFAVLTVVNRGPGSIPQTLLKMTVGRFKTIQGIGQLKGCFAQAALTRNMLLDLSNRESNALHGQPALIGQLKFDLYRLVSFSRPHER